MISQAESGLGSANYALLEDQGVQPSYQVIASRYHLKFASVDNDGRDSDNLFDVAMTGTTMLRLRVSADKLLADRWTDADSLSSSAWASTDTVVIASGVTDVAPSAIAYSSTVRCFFYTGTKIRYVETSDGGASWGSAVDVVTESGVAHLAATSETKVHWVEYRSDNNSRLHYAEWGGASWASVNSSIYWAHEFTGFDAVALDDGIDVIVFTSGFPPNVGIRAEGVKTRKLVYRSGGLGGFIQRNGRWGEHFEIDVFDDEHSTRTRKYPKLSWINDRLVCVCYGIDGTSPYSYACHHLYTSMNGYQWRVDELVYIIGAQHAAMFVGVEDMAYIVTSEQVQRDRQTALFGADHEVLQTDLTTYIGEYSSRFGSMRQTNMQIRESTWLDTLPLVTDPGIFMVKHYWGFNVGGVINRVLVSTEEVDTIEHESNLPARQGNIQSRDRLMWMSDRYRAPYVFERESQMTGYDSFQDNTQTGFGGLRHTAVQYGSWGTKSDELELRSSNKEGMALSTFKLLVWNGSIQAGFQWASDGNDEYAGVVFRALDRDNCWMAIYDEDTDRIKLIERRGGSDKLRVISGANLGWSLGNQYYIKVVTLYSLITVYRSTDGATWTLVFSYIAPGEQVSLMFEYLIYEEGSFGLAGRGYSTDDVWEWKSPAWSIDPITSTTGLAYTFPEPTYTLPDAPSGWPAAEIEDSWPINIAALMANGALCRAKSITPGSPIQWEAIDTGLSGDCDNGSSEHGDIIYNPTTGEYLCATSAGIFACPDIWTNDPADVVWTLRNASTYAWKIVPSLIYPGHVFWHGYGPSVYISHDSGATFTSSYLDDGLGGFRCRDIASAQGGASVPDMEIMFAIGVNWTTPGNPNQLFKSIDGGVTWLRTDLSPGNGSYAGIEVPTWLSVGELNTDGLHFRISYGDTSGALKTKWTVNGGVTFVDAQIYISGQNWMFPGGYNHTAWSVWDRHVQFCVVRNNSYNVRLARQLDHSGTWEFGFPGGSYRGVGGFNYNGMWWIIWGYASFLRISTDANIFGDYFGDLQTVSGSSGIRKVYVGHDGYQVAS